MIWSIIVRFRPTSLTPSSVPSGARSLLSLSFLSDPKRWTREKKTKKPINAREGNEETDRRSKRKRSVDARKGNDQVVAKYMVLVFIVLYCIWIRSLFLLRLLFSLGRNSIAFTYKYTTRSINSVLRRPETSSTWLTLWPLQSS
jgi:hypothetical protein